MNKETLTDVGVIVGRFQVDELHEGHRNLIEFVLNRHKRTVIFLGLAPTKSTYNNPLDFESRKQMISEAYPEILVLYIKDCPSDVIWSKQLDEQLGDVLSPEQTVTLYGSRDSFIRYYFGRHQCYELEQTVFISGKEQRKAVRNAARASSKDFRAGAIWATSNQYPRALPTVDIAILNDTQTKLLLAKKPTESAYRFVGGFVGPEETLEAAARREVAEETHLEITDPQFITSIVVDDWRYKGERDNILTTLFYAQKMFGAPTPDDDISELRWFNISDTGDIEFEDETIVPTHQPLVEAFTKFYNMKLPKVNSYNG